MTRRPRRNPRATSLVVLTAALFIAAPSFASAGAKRVPLIVNGSQIAIAQRPYQAAILNITNGVTRVQQFICGGSVIAPTLVITAGHCTYDSLTQGTPTAANHLRVLVNSDDLVSGGQLVSVASISRHPNYNPVVSDEYDAAILHLTIPVSAPPIQVIAAQSDYRYAGGARSATVSGWGCYINRSTNTCRTQADYPTRLRAATIPVFSQGSCLSQYSLYNVGYDPTSMICAGNSSTAALAPAPCYGDSGGPLTVPGIGGDYLIGLVSWGVGTKLCGSAPVAFTRLGGMRAWLQSEGVSFQPPAFGHQSGPAIAPNAVPVAGDFNGDTFDDVYSYVPGITNDQIFRGASNASMTAGSTYNLNGLYSPLGCDINADGLGDVELYGPGSALDGSLLGQPDPGGFVGNPSQRLNQNYVVVTGQFDAGGTCDLLLYQPGTNAEILSLGNGDGTFTRGPNPFNVNGNYTPFSGDFNGDGFSDVYWFAPGFSTLWRGSATGVFSHASVPAVIGHPIPLVGDFNGDSKDDIFWYGPGAMPDALWYSNSAGTGFVRTNDVNVTSTYRAAVGDFNGDGFDDILWTPATGGSGIWLGH